VPRGRGVIPLRRPDTGWPHSSVDIQIYGRRGLVGWQRHRISSPKADASPMALTAWVWVILDEDYGRITWPLTGVCGVRVVWSCGVSGIRDWSWARGKVAVNIAVMAAFIRWGGGHASMADLGDHGWPSPAWQGRMADGSRVCLWQEGTQRLAEPHQARSDAGLDRAEGLPECGGDLGVA
jgi:hypothetical protein